MFRPCPWVGDLIGALALCRDEVMHEQNGRFVSGTAGFAVAVAAALAAGQGWRMM